MDWPKLFIKKVKKQGKPRFRAIKYPNIPLSIQDLYIVTSDFDRLDNLANLYYGDSNLWWIILAANPDIISRDGVVLKSGIHIRIPSDVEGITQIFQTINTTSQ